MAEKFAFELVSPEKLLVAQQVEMVVVPGGDGHFGVLKGHMSMLSTIQPGVIDVYEQRSAISSRLFVTGGFAEVTPERCTVLAEEVVPVASLDRAKVEQELRDAEEDVADAKTPGDKAVAERALKLARAKLTAVTRGAAGHA
ncbi:F0F1 ATP synthase subunit epsilon [Inquilinus sp. NPDC058860]|uniref:F0F1 ATP synthase subunit epsilon n=1 Tax=Inquilinus sp. NPDC058860 TaxID=3346652 RepID=UPI0036BD3897